MTRHDFIQTALTWVGTPYHHEARLKGVGCDCIGMLIGAAESGGIAVRGIPATYSRSPNPDMLFAVIKASGQLEEIPTESARPGDVLLFRVLGDPTHFGLLTDAGFVHTDLSFGVVETTLDDRWRRRIVKAYRMIALEDA